MKIWIFLLCITTTYKAYSIEELAPWNKIFVAQVFEDPQFYDSIEASDSIDATSGNYEILKVYNSEKTHLGYVREVYSYSGCQHVCASVEFALAYDVNMKLIEVFSRPNLGLLKYEGQEEFLPADYKKLLDLVQDIPEIFYLLKHPHEIAENIDGITGATLPQYKDYVVHSAALTCFRVIQYHNDTIAQM